MKMSVEEKKARARKHSKAYYLKNREKILAKTRAKRYSTVQKMSAGLGKSQVALELDKAIKENSKMYNRDMPHPEYEIVWKQEQKIGEAHYESGDHCGKEFVYECALTTRIMNLVAIYEHIDIEIKKLR
jgi:hypothetical protein